MVNDTALLQQLTVASGEAELYDPSGRLIGRYLPEDSVPSPPNGVQSPYSAEELDEMEKGPGMSLADFWKSMGRT